MNVLSILSVVCPICAKQADIQGRECINTVSGLWKLDVFCHACKAHALVYVRDGTFKDGDGA